MIQRILVAYDTSEQAEKAFNLGLDLAAKYEAEMIVLSVARPPEPPEMVEAEAVLENATEFYERHFKDLGDKAAKAGIAIRCVVKVGHPAEQIIHLANEEKVDMILMGHRGKTFIKRWLLGSISRRVVSYAHCSVVIVR